jgi:S1-C subfamily serine protease
MIERLGMASFTAPLLQPGDIIIRVDDRGVTTSAEIERYLRSISPGSMVVVTVVRDDETHYVMLQVPSEEEPPASPPIELPPAPPPAPLP